MQVQPGIRKSLMGDPAANDDGSQSRCKGSREKQPLKQLARRRDVEQPGRNPQGPGKAEGDEHVSDDAFGCGRMPRLLVGDARPFLLISLSLLRLFYIFHGFLLSFTLLLSGLAFKWRPLPWASKLMASPTSCIW